jgi:RsiW-degrading membrane proteinase PrsW (M82 family)
MIDAMLEPNDISSPHVWDLIYFHFFVSFLILLDTLCFVLMIDPSINGFNNNEPPQNENLASLIGMFFGAHVCVVAAGVILYSV